ncbi:RhuM family protein [Sulfurimonas sp.]
MIDNNQIVVYDNGEIELKVSMNDDTIWLTQKQLSELFEKDVRTINDHIKTIYKDGELHEDSTIRKFRIVQKEGKRAVARDVLHYNLDIVISVGYKVNSKKATRFRQWATKILKAYIANGYVINSEKITVDRFLNLENDMDMLKQKVNIIDKLVVSNQLEVTQGIFHDGQIYDAYSFINDLLRSAKKEITLIDNYIDDTVLTLFSKYPDIKFTVITKSISKQLKLDSKKYNTQYSKLTIKVSNKYHDRFLIIDKNEVYHIGASLKDLGKKVFAFNKIDVKLVMESIDE